jgi:hypothetical protein
VADDEPAVWSEDVWLKLSAWETPECSKLPILPPPCDGVAFEDDMEKGAGVSAGSSDDGNVEDTLPECEELISWFDASLELVPCNASL